MSSRFRQELKSYPCPKATASRKLIDRWLDNDRADEVWFNLKKSRPAAEAAPFIKAMLNARRSAQATVNRVFGVTGSLVGFNDEWAVFFPALKKRLGTLSKNLGPLDVAAILDDAAQELRTVHLMYFGSADHARFELSRKDQDGSRVRKLFMQIAGNYVLENFGKHFDSEIAILTEIAFPDGKNLDRDDAINARKATTTAERLKNRRPRSGTFKRNILG
jgi:hypothetical protein